MNYIKIIIPGILPDLNSDLALAKKVSTVKGKRIPGLQYSEHKKKWTNIVAWETRSQYRGKTIDQPCAFIFEWYFKNDAKDPDNCYFAQKHVFDGLVKGGLLKDDSYQWTSGGASHIPRIDKKNPRLELYIMPGFIVENPCLKK